jgi:hypothetical protein
VARSGLFVSPVPGTPPVGTSATDARLALSGILGTTAQVVSGGVLTTSGSALTISVSATVWQLPDVTNANASFISATDAAVLTFAAGPATGSRIDSIAVKQNNYENGDADSRVNVIVVAGTAAPSPVAPTLPSGYFRYANVLAHTGDTYTSQFTITNLAPTTYNPLSISAATLALLNMVAGKSGQLATVTADSTAANNGLYWWTGTAWANYYTTVPVNTNYIINGAFDVWQRGASGFTSGYSADRWFLNGSNVAAQSTDVPSGFKYSMSATNTSTTNAGISQRIESQNASNLVGQTITVSAWFKRTGTTPGNSLSVNMDFATAADNFASTTYAGAALLSSTSPAATWTKYSATYSFVAPAGVANGVQFTFKHDGNAGSNLGGLWTGIQIEIGSSATTFHRSALSVQGELAACQRYYFRTVSTQAYSPITTWGTAQSSTVIYGTVVYPVTMRATPTSVEFASLLGYDGVGTTIPVWLVSLNQISNSMAGLAFTVNSASLTQYRPHNVISNNTVGAYLGLSAEL